MCISMSMMVISIPILAHNFANINSKAYTYIMGDNSTTSLNGMNLIQQILNEVMTNSTMLIGGNLTNNSTTTGYTYRFCNEFTKKLNIIGSTNCASSNVATLTPNFITTNGMNWYGLDKDFNSVTGNLTVYVDINGSNQGVNSNSESNPDQDIYAITINNQGIAECPAAGTNEMNALGACVVYTPTFALPADPSCGATNIVTGSATLRVSLCNNSINAQANTYSQTSGCWIGADSGASAGNNPGGQAYTALPVCTQDVAANVCSALNNGTNYGSHNWRLPTAAEIEYWRTTYGVTSPIIASVKTSLGLCDSDSSYPPYCTNSYYGCIGSYHNMCNPMSVWVSDTTTAGSLQSGMWYAPAFSYTGSAYTIRCVRN